MNVHAKRYLILFCVTIAELLLRRFVPSALFPELYFANYIIAAVFSRKLDKRLVHYLEVHFPLICLYDKTITRPELRRSLWFRLWGEELDDYARGEARDLMILEVWGICMSFGAAYAEAFAPFFKQ